MLNELLFCMQQPCCRKRDVKEKGEKGEGYLA